MRLSDELICIGARDSNLSRAQVWEVLQEQKVYCPSLHFSPCYVKTQGDKDKQSSLREMEKTDFFTREIDDMLLQGECRMGIHSAKDLPDPIPKGLTLAYLTKGVDPSDSLVMRDQDHFFHLPAGSKIATSSMRRMQNILKLRGDIRIVDIRGTIEERLDSLFSKMIDGLVVAEAALIRLKFTHLNRISLPGEVALHQGRLAVIVRDNDAELLQFFRSFQKDLY